MFIRWAALKKNKTGEIKGENRRGRRLSQLRYIVHQLLQGEKQERIQNTKTVEGWKTGSYPTSGDVQMLGQSGGRREAVERVE